MHIYQHAAQHPDRVAYVMADKQVSVTYRMLEERSNQVAQLFRAQGLQKGDHIAFQLENHELFLVITWAAQRSGLIYTAINSSLKADESKYLIEDCDAKLFITSAAHSAVANDLSSRLSPDVALFMIDGTVQGFSPFESAIAEMPKERISDEGYGFNMLYSSGTTGRPKGILPKYSEQPIEFVTTVDQYFNQGYGLNDTATYLSPAPMYHAAPLNACMAITRFGGTAVIMGKFDAENALKYIEQYRITHSQMVPSMFVRMLKLPEESRSKYDVSSLKLVIHAAAPCPIPVKQQMIDWFGPILVEYYSGTENQGGTVISSQEWLTHQGSVGRPGPTCKLHILDDDGNELAAGETGMVYFEPLDGRKFEYYKSPEKTQSSMTAQGWSTLGDIGYVDEEGYLYLTDRKAFMIISGGVNIYPQEAENVLITHPKVGDVAVFGIPNEEFGEEVKAVIEPANWSDAGDALAEELITYCREHLSKVKCPKSIDFMQKLPRQATGKLYKTQLRDKYWQAHKARVN